MKLKLTILFLAVASIAMAQKKEMRKIEKAITSNKLSTAVEIFNSIDESEVEPKYAGQYSFYKAAIVIGVSGESSASLDETYQSLVQIKKAQELGYDDEELIALVESKAKDRLFVIANEQLKSNNNKEALEIVNYLSSSDPDNLMMLLNAGDLAYKAEEFDLAINKYQTLLNKKFTGEESTFTAFNKSTLIQEVFPSEKLRNISVSSGTHNNPQFEKTPSQLGRLITSLVWMYKNSDQMDKAKSTFEKALDDFPDDETLKIAKADNYLTLEMMEEYKKATESMTEEVKDPKIYDNLAIASLSSKDYDQAIKYYELSIGIDPQNFIAQANLGLAYVEKGNLQVTTAKDQLELYRKAIACYEIAHKINSEDKNAINTLISLYGVFDNTEKVEELRSKL